MENRGQCTKIEKSWEMEKLLVIKMDKLIDVHVQNDRCTKNRENAHHGRWIELEKLFIRQKLYWSGFTVEIDKFYQNL